MTTKDQVTKAMDAIEAEFVKMRANEPRPALPAKREPERTLPSSRIEREAQEERRVIRTNGGKL